jgi:hypothetical protein
MSASSLGYINQSGMFVLFNFFPFALYSIFQPNHFLFDNFLVCSSDESRLFQS